MNSLKSFLTLVLLSLLANSAVLAEPPEFEASKSKEKIKVFILAGQSNMEGRGFPDLSHGRSDRKSIANVIPTSSKTEITISSSKR